MANTINFNIKTFQKTFNFKCRDTACHKKQLVYLNVIDNSQKPLTSDFACVSCHAQYIYDWDSKTINFDPNWIAQQQAKQAQQNKINHANKQQRAFFNSGTQTGRFTGGIWSNSQYPTLRSLKDGYDIFELREDEIATKDPWEYEHLLKSNGIGLDINTKRFNDEKNRTIIFLQLPQDWTLFTELKPKMKAVTKNNYVGIYLSWCMKCNIPPLKHNDLVELFKDCESNQDYKLILELIMQNNLRSPKDIEAVIMQRLKIRIELFNRVPSGTNMLLAYQLIEEFTLKQFENSKLDTSDVVVKLVERFDKCKNLALGTKFIEERKTAFNTSLQIFKKLNKIEIL